jgi:hypothetical protein
VIICEETVSLKFAKGAQTTFVWEMSVRSVQSQARDGNDRRNSAFATSEGLAATPANGCSSSTVAIRPLVMEMTTRYTKNPITKLRLDTQPDAAVAPPAPIPPSSRTMSTNYNITAIIGTKTPAHAPCNEERARLGFLSSK